MTIKGLNKKEVVKAIVTTRNLKEAADKLRVNQHSLRGYMHSVGIKARELKRSVCVSCGVKLQTDDESLCKECAATKEGHILRSKLPYLDNLGKGLYLITGMSVRSEVFEKALKACETFAKVHDAKIMIVGGRAHVKALSSQPNTFDKRVSKYIIRGARLNNNLEVVDLELNPQQLNPVGGLERYGILSNPAQSIIVSHPYFQMRMFASRLGPRFVATTGSINRPDYLTDRKQGALADDRHCLRGWIVEVLDDDNFRPIPIEFDPIEGYFTHKAYTYHPSGIVQRERVKYLIAGDAHADTIDVSLGSDVVHKPTQVLLKTIERYEPENIVFHDLMTSPEASHHNKNISMIHFDTYERTLKRVRKYVQLLSMSGAKIHIVASNHDLHLSNYFDAGDFRKVGKAYPLLLKHCVSYLNTGNIYNYILKGMEFNYVSPDANELVYKGIDMSHHGHKADSGIKGTIKSISKLNARAVKGHTHSAGIEGYVDQVGYSGGYQDFCRGALSNWTIGNCIIYENGQKQLFFRPL